MPILETAERRTRTDRRSVARHSGAVELRAALERGEIDAGRWDNYRKLQGELAAASNSLANQQAKKSDARVMDKALGKRLTEKYGKR